MKKFRKVLENYELELLKNKLIDKSKLNISIDCDFCSFREEFKCDNKVSDKEEWWLSSEKFIQSGWGELVTPEKKGISCPSCIYVWKSGNWYQKK